MKQVGIWLDKQEANGVVLNNGKESLFNIPSELDFFNPKGGARSKTKWGRKVPRIGGQGKSNQNSR